MLNAFNNIKTVFVDIDDTLWDFSANSPLALLETYDHFVGDAGLRDRFVEEYKQKNTELWDLYHYGKIEKDFLVAERFRYALERIGWHDTSIGSEMNDWYLDNLANRSIIVPGADALLEHLSHRYLVGALSNGSIGIQARKLRSGGIDNYIKIMVLSDEVGITKPLPGIFECAMQRCACAPEEIVMIGDNYDADILGAHRMGWRTIFFNRKGVQVEENVATATVSSLNEIIDLL